MSRTPDAEVVASSWTSAGAVAPLYPDERSTYSIDERIAALAKTGWSGMGLNQADLAEIKRTIGFEELRRRLDAAGLEYREVEFLNDWWLEEELWRETWELLLEAAGAIGASFVKVGAAFNGPEEDFGYLVEPFRRLGREAAERGLRVAIEPIAFSGVDTTPKGAALVREAGLPNVGICIDFWHVFRAGTPFSEITAAVSGEQVFSVEMGDCPAESLPDLFTDTIDNRRLCGEGDFDVQGLVDAIRATGFAGPWGVEMLSREYRKLPLEDAVRVARDAALPYLVRRGAAVSG
ncbi:sugar phosphate isomerase/epimerase [Leucobacter muris]|uniref:Sugar phosphate isomerase/epimerase n=1 Tax=Leucobacter muris TaxID=1935379 RepID=A0ABX5QIR7_9MICO|nr:sugar phosphate isomerase/epimerase family protein [Leucobacter muris]QAB18996.1 sugar phosphate isomerase/epimerase [Leucobacter muris]